MKLIKLKGEVSPYSRYWSESKLNRVGTILVNKQDIVAVTDAYAHDGGLCGINVHIRFLEKDGEPFRITLDMTLDEFETYIDTDQ